MYPVHLGYDTAISRIHSLIEHGHQAEALVTSMFTVEKTLRRTLRQLIVSAGFTSPIANIIIARLRGLTAIQDAWKLYDPQNEQITDFVSSSDWQTFKYCAEMRNKLVHGERVYDLVDCKKRSQEIVHALTRLKGLLDQRYGYSGWTSGSRRVQSRLHVDPKVTIHLNEPKLRTDRKLLKRS